MFSELALVLDQTEAQTVLNDSITACMTT